MGTAKINMGEACEFCKNSEYCLGVRVADAVWPRALWYWSQSISIVEVVSRSIALIFTISLSLRGQG